MNASRAKMTTRQSDDDDDDDDDVTDADRVVLCDDAISCELRFGRCTRCLQW